MRFKPFALIAILTMLGACGKSNQTATSQPATIILKDGTTVSGTITKSDTSSVTMQTPNGVVTTYPMTQVSSINYGSASPANQQPSNPASPASAQNTPSPAQTTPVPAPESAPPAVQAPLRSLRMRHRRKNTITSLRPPTGRCRPEPRSRFVMTRPSMRKMPSRVRLFPAPW